MIVAEDKRKMIAEITPVRAVAVIKRSQLHFRDTMREIYRMLRGALYVVCGERDHVLREDESLTIYPGVIYYMTTVGEPVWIEVESEPPWPSEGYHVM